MTWGTEKPKIESLELVQTDKVYIFLNKKTKSNSVKGFLALINT